MTALRLRLAALCLSALSTAMATAQGTPPSTAKQPSAPAATPATRVPMGAARADAPAPGQGAGYHSPQSRFPPLKDRPGVVSWAVLSAVTKRVEDGRILPVFTPAAKALDKKTVTLQGFMMPLEPGRMQANFLLSAVPTTCSFCTPAGAEGLVSVRGKSTLPFSENAITVRGTLTVLTHDLSGLYYRLDDAKIVK
jgi:uncharacterized protein